VQLLTVRPHLYMNAAAPLYYMSPTSPPETEKKEKDKKTPQKAEKDLCVYDTMQCERDSAWYFFFTRGFRTELGGPGYLRVLPPFCVK